MRVAHFYSSLRIRQHSWRNLINFNSTRSRKQIKKKYNPIIISDVRRCTIDGDGNNLLVRSRVGGYIQSIYLARVSERVSSVGRVDAVELTRDPVACRLRVPQGLAADGDPETGHADLAHINHHGGVRALRWMVAGAGRVMRMRLMGAMNAVVRIMQAVVVVGAVHVVMGAVQAVMRVVHGLMGIVARYERIGEAERVRVTITVPDRRAAAGRHVIAG